MYICAIKVATARAVTLKICAACYDHLSQLCHIGGKENALNCLNLLYIFIFICEVMVVIIL